MAAPTPYSSSPTTVYAIDGNLSTDIKTFLNGTKWGNSGVGTGATVYYSFPTSNSTALWDQSADVYLYAPGYETYAGFRGLTVTQQTIASTILQNWANVANINLSHVATETASEVGDIRIAFTSDGFMTAQDYAYAYFPGPSFGGDVWLNAVQPAASGNNFNPGGNGYHTILHEVGHALGLEHSFGGFYTLSNTSYDSFKYTVMSYSDAPLHQDRGNSSFYPTTPMLLDIQAMQYLYGANMSYNAGDDIYVFNGSTNYYQTIWDAGGTDTIQYASSTGGVINLEAGSFSVLGKAIKLDKGTMQSDNVAIAYNVTIENAIGGDGHDTVYGNNVANILQGGNGNDSLYGQASNDTLNGDAGNDYLDGGADKDTLSGGAGDDTYIVDDLDDAVLETLTLAQLGGVDIVKSSVDFTLGDNVDHLTLTDGSANGGLANLNGTGNALSNIITGNAGNNVLDGKAGNDSLFGGLGNDTYVVDVVQIGSTVSTPVVVPATNPKKPNKPAPVVAAPATPGVQLEDTVSEAVNAGTDTLQVRGNLDIAQAATIVLGANLEVLDASNTGITKLNLTGNGLDNILLGNAADNILDGGLGVDTLAGGDGNDTYWVDIVASGVSPNTTAVLQDTVIENANAGVDALKLRGSVALTNATLLSLSNTEFEQLDASATGTTKLNLEGNAANNVLVGNAADNVITGGDGNDTLDGGLGNDSMNGGNGDDTLVAGAGNDQLDGGTGSDTLIGGLGNDVLSGGLGADIFKWTLADKGAFRNASIDQITDFNVSENDVLDLRDLLTGESIANLLGYLDIKTNGAHTELSISTRGGFSNGTVTAATENNHITLLNVDLFAATNTSTEAELIQQLINTNKLVIDT